jgi:hypothetical protein
LRVLLRDPQPGIVDIRRILDYPILGGPPIRRACLCAGISVRMKY